MGFHGHNHSLPDYIQWRIHGGPEGPRTLPWLQVGPCFSPNGDPLLVTSVSVRGYFFLLVDVFRLSVALIQTFIGAHIIYWTVINTGCSLLNEIK